jgi:hypothetical protein
MAVDDRMSVKLLLVSGVYRRKFLAKIAFSINKSPGTFSTRNSERTPACYPGFCAFEASVTRKPRSAELLMRRECVAENGKI